MWRKFTSLLETRLLPIIIPATPKIIAVDGFYLSYPSLKRNRHKDGFKRDKCILLWTIDCETHKPIYWQFYDEIENMCIWKSFINEMAYHGFNPECLISDGHPGIINACSVYWEDTRQQRCIAHFMSNMNKDLGISPKTDIAKDLKKLVSSLFSVNNAEDRLCWEQRWLDYVEKYRNTISSMSFKTDMYENTIRIPKEYLSAFSVINNAYERDEIFAFLENPNIPKTSNVIESVNGVLRELTRRHRGLSLEQRKSLIAWALAYRQGQTNYQLKQQIAQRELTK